MKTGMSAGLTDSQVAQITRRSALGRLAETEDVARVVDFLMGEGGRSLTGADIIVDAGSTA
jgi:3-oxoacyl-[acyl-carrier protein] reductase